MDGSYESLCLNLLGNLPLIINNKGIFKNKIIYMNLILPILFLKLFSFQSGFLISLVTVILILEVLIKYLA